MVSAILHVEDDLALRGLVELAFRGFGFRGTMVEATSVEQATQRLAQTAEIGDRIDLVVTDMNLPDGSGLDVVRYVRSTIVWKFTPVLVLSGDVNPKLVGRAYALGANAYIDKSPRGRTLSDVIKSLYEHWSKDAVLPAPPEAAAAERRIVAAISLRKRHAQLYHRLAEVLGEDSRSESAFWLSRALAESNLVNLLELLHQHIADAELPDGAYGEIAAQQTMVEERLTTAEQVVERMPVSRDEAYRQVVNLVAAVNNEVLASVISHLFPIAPVAMEAMRDFLLGTVEDVAAWVEVRATEPALRDQAAKLRTAASPLEKQNPGDQ